MYGAIHLQDHFLYSLCVGVYNLVIFASQLRLRGAIAPTLLQTSLILSSSNDADSTAEGAFHETKI
jgi:hypothetical protein